MLPPEERLRILLAETHRLEDYLTRLSKEDWIHPTACSEWCVADVVAHLARNSRNTAPRISRALQGDASPDDLSPRRALGSVDPVSMAQRTIASRKGFGEPDAILPEFLAANIDLRQTLSIVGPGDWDKPVYREAGPEPISNMVDVKIAELSLHGWDIRSQFDPSAALSPEAVPVMVERIAQRPKWWSFKQGASPLPIRYRFEVATPAPYLADVVVTEVDQYMEVASDKKADVIFRCDGETYVMLMYGRVAPSHVLNDARLSFEGGQMLVTTFADCFVGG